MMIVLLLLGAFVCKGLSYDFYHEEEYGNSYQIHLRRKADLIEFIPKYSSNKTVLWKVGDRQVSVDRKHLMMGSYLALLTLNQKDSGRYIVRDKDGKELSTHTLEVKATTRTYNRKPNERLSFFYKLEPKSCNIYFFPESVHRPTVLKNEIVHQGRLQKDLDELDCVGFNLLDPCGISIEALQMSCKGRYEIRDQNNNTALVVSLSMERITRTFEQKPGERFSFVFHLEPKSCYIYFFPENDYQIKTMSIDLVHHGSLLWDLERSNCKGFHLLHPCGISIEDLQMACSGRYEIRDQNGNTAVEVSLEMEPLPYEPSRIGIGAGVFIASLFCYGVRHCCCRKSPSKKGRSVTAAAKPDVRYQEHDHEPVGPRPDQRTQPSGTHYPTLRSYTPTSPLIHNHPTVNVPPAYSEVSAPAEPADAPTVPVHSDPVPQFELKGMTFPSAPPLSSDSTNCAVYTSDKLNFL